MPAPVIKKGLTKFYVDPFDYSKAQRKGEIGIFIGFTEDGDIQLKFEDGDECEILNFDPCQLTPVEVLKETA